MKNILQFSLLLSILISFSCNNQTNTNCEDKCKAHKDSTSQIKASEQLVMSVLWYQYSAEMQACYYQTFNIGKNLLKENLKEYKGNKKKAVVVDIDETILNNTPFEEKIIETEFLFTDSTWKAWSNLGIAKALPGAIEFLKYAEELGIEVFYITNRDQDELIATKQNLINEGLPFVDEDHLLFRIEKQSDKTDRRNQISENYEILLLVGDNLRDFDETFKQRENNLGFDKVVDNKELFGKKYLILPNPMYGEWEKAIYGGKFPETEEEMIKLRKSFIKSEY
jgi:5'-nucleotidase (lipoprotein e(P4) family)